MPEFFNNFNWEIFKKPNQSFRNVDYDPNAELNWDAHDWLSQRAENDRGPKYTEQDVKIFNSHVPEYKQIEQNSKSNGTWLQMPDGSRWVGDPREWVMMQSEAFKKNYQENPWYTGQAEWETQVTLPNDTIIDTDKVKRARYHNGEMWFSNDAGYAQYFADTVGRGGLGIRGQFINNPNYKTDRNIKGTVFLAGIPKTGNYRKLEGPKTGYDHWRHMPFVLTETGFERTNEKTNLLTDDLVSHSRKLGDDGLFLFNVNDGPVLRNKYKENKMLPYFTRPGHMNNDPNSRLETVPINEFISQPGFTEKIKFIRGNNGNFDPNTDDKYSTIFKIDSPLFAKKGGSIHIKKKNRGKFTEYCGGKVTEECIAKGKKSKDPKIRKRATFAANARKWKHENGGILKAQEGTGNLLTPHPLSPVGIALNQAKIIAKMKGDNVLDRNEDKTPWLKSIIQGVKSAAMEYAQLNQSKSLSSVTKIPSLLSHIKQARSRSFEDPTQSIFLFSPEDQRDVLLKNGYIKDDSKNYGLVSKAVGNRNIPLYTRPDVQNRDNLTVVANPSSVWFGSKETELQHAGFYPTALYIDANGNFYQQAFDLNDYGNKDGNAGSTYEGWRQFGANLLDKIGNPFVIKSGIQHADKKVILDYLKSSGDTNLKNKLIPYLSKDEVKSIDMDNFRKIYNSFLSTAKINKFVDQNVRNEVKKTMSFAPYEKAVPFEKFVNNINDYYTQDELKDFGL